MNIYYEKQIGKNIKRLREYQRLTQEQLSARLQVQGCDLTRSAVAKIEVGQRHLYVSELILLRRILGVSYEELLDVEKPEDSQEERK